MRSVDSLDRYLNTIQCADSAAFLRNVPSDSVDLTITSPPYFQQRMYAGNEAGGERLVNDYIDAVHEVFRECIRVIKPTGSVVFNMGDKYVNGSLVLVPYRFAMHILDADKTIKLINDITWIKTNPTPRQYRRRLVSSTEPFFHFVKSADYYYDMDSFQAQEARPAPQVRSLGSRYVGLIEKSDLTKSEKEDALVALEKTVDDVRDGKIAGFRMKIRDIHSLPFGGNEGGRLSQLRNQGYTIIRMSGQTLKKDAIPSKVESLKWNDHPAIYPVGIIKELIQLLTPPGAVVLDPYMGSGTTGVAAKMLGRNYVGVDISPTFCAQAVERIRKTEPIAL